MSESVQAATHDADTCVRCQTRLTVRVHPEPRPGRPQDERISYSCNACLYEIRVHRFVNRFEDTNGSVGPRYGGSG
jgi:hypothetical protein